MKQRENKDLDYRAMAVWAFRRAAGGVWPQLIRRGLVEDWNQEIAAAAWQAEQRQLGRAEAFRLFDRLSWHALRSMGFYRDRDCPWSSATRLRLRIGNVTLSALQAMARRRLRPV
jgi:hypothetical protein